MLVYQRVCIYIYSDFPKSRELRPPEISIHCKHHLVHELQHARKTVSAASVAGDPQVINLPNLWIGIIPK